MTALKETEARVVWALKQVAEGVEISDTDQRRVEDKYRERLGSGHGGRWHGQRPLALMGVAACVVLAVALAAVVLLGRPAQRPAPAVPSPSALTVADLVGVWRLDAWSDAPVWEFRADGRLEPWNGPEDLLEWSRSELGSFTLEGDVLAVTPRPACELRLRVLPPFGAQIAVTKLSISPECAMRFYDQWWVDASLTRILPTADPTIQPGYQVGSQLQPVTWMADVNGIWLLRGTSRIISIYEGRYFAGDQLSEMDSRGVRSVDERGTVLVVGHDVTFKPDGARCEWRYVNVATDYARLSLHLAGDPCGGSGAPEESWLRLR